MSMVQGQFSQSIQSSSPTGYALACRQVDRYSRIKNEEVILRHSGLNPEEIQTTVKAMHEAYDFKRELDDVSLGLRQLYGVIEKQPVALPAYIDTPALKKNLSKPDGVTRSSVSTPWFKYEKVLKDSLEFLSQYLWKYANLEGLTPELRILETATQTVGLGKVIRDGFINKTCGSINIGVYSGLKQEYKWLPDVLNQLITELHYLLHSDEYKLKAYRRHRRFRENQQSCMKMIRYLMKCFRRLLVLRVDVSYLKKYCKDIPCEKFLSDLNRLFMNRRDNKIFKGWVGFIRKLEYGEEKGPHAHFLIFFDGSVRMPNAHAYIAQQICAYWAKLTNGKGYAYNCNSVQHLYKHVAVGCLHRDDQVMLDALTYVINYLCKEEQHNSSYYPPKTKMMTRSHIELAANEQQPDSPCHNKDSP